MEDTLNVNSTDLEEQWQMYISSLGITEDQRITEDQMHPEQRRQLKQAWMGAAAQMLLLFRNLLTAPAKPVRAIVQDMNNQAITWWQQELKRPESDV